MEPVIRCEQLSKEYYGLDWRFQNGFNLNFLHGHEALVDVDLTIQKGECFSLVGHNGSGKSTLIRLLMNLVKPGTGKTTILGKESGQLTFQEWQRIGYVSESQEIPKNLTIQSWFSYLSPLYPTWDSTFAQQLLSDFDLDKRKPIRTLSRGMHMKVALLSAIAYRPEVLVLDEPFAGIDPLVREEFIEGILDVSAEHGWTILLATHDIEEVAKITDRIGMLESGRMVMNEAVETIQDQYVKVRVALPEASAELPEPSALPSDWINFKSQSRQVVFIDTKYTDEPTLKQQLQRSLGDCSNIETTALTLREVLVEKLRAQRNG